MTKKDLAKMYVDKGYCSSVTEAAAHIDYFIDVLHEAILTGDKVALHGFPTMQIVERPTFEYRNPQTGDYGTTNRTKRIKITQTPSFRELASLGQAEA